MQFQVQTRYCVGAALALVCASLHSKKACLEQLQVPALQQSAFPPGSTSANSATVSAHLGTSRIPQTVSSVGAAVARQVFKPSQIQHVCKNLEPILYLRGADATVSKSELDKIAQELAETADILTSAWQGNQQRKRARKPRKGDLVWKEQAPGRFHLQLLHSAVDPALLRVLEGALWPMAAAVAGRSPAENSPESMQLTEIQLVASQADCDDQTWHVDNSLGGVTLLVPLHDTPIELGPTEFLPGTHRAFRGPHPAPSPGFSAPPSSARLAYNLYSICPNGACAAQQPALSAGDCLVMDARTVHRGAKNNSTRRKPRFALIFRYDEWGAHPQTAQSPLTVLAVAQAGKLLAQPR